MSAPASAYPAGVQGKLTILRPSAHLSETHHNNQRSTAVLGRVATAAERDCLSPAALAFVATLQRAFNPRRKELLRVRQLRQQQIDAGRLPHFLPETAHVRDDQHWRAAPPAPGLVRGGDTSATRI